MKNIKINELNSPTETRPSEEEQLSFIENLSKKASDHLEQMKLENPDVVEWVRQGRPTK